ncbi:uncharacterized protein LOC129948113 isoform X2 [Eupeodes corollae]|uniref:uncharacterized protein LOC129948113 isoform X2 n=1 Tax=Eupeodes corollae TaxID=290404 RepID=UPI00249313D0|nr:uncharacterized protein LOC129948113 isoform X2 [Eupeodes corollae]
MNLVFVTILAIKLLLSSAYPSDGLVDKRLGRLNSNGDVVSFPYYGALKGHSLNIGKDDKINTVVVLNPKYAEGRGSSDTFFNKIQDSAARLVAIQEKAKQKGSFSEDDNKSYADSLFELGLAAQSLAQLQQNGEIKDFSKLLQGSNSQMRPQTGTDNPSQTPVSEMPNPNGDNMFVSITQDEPYDDSGESILVNAPKKDASVAEAKPVGLSIAGEGGVASSKPNAVAIAGREGLAVASPKATAIAGVSPEEAAAFSVNVPTRNDIIIKAQQRGITSGAPAATSSISSQSTSDESKLSENEAQKRKSQVVEDSGVKNILIVEPRLAERIALQGKHQALQVKSEVEPRGLGVQNVPSAGFDENKYLHSNSAYRNYLLSSFYAS